MIWTQQMSVFSPSSLLFSDSPSGTHTHVRTHTQTLVECVNSLMAWLPFERNILTKKYEVTELVFLWLILSPSPSDWEGPFNSRQAPVFCPVNYIHTNLPASYPLFHFLETVFKEHILCIACLPLFWINPHFSPCIHKIKIVVQRECSAAHSLGSPTVLGLDWWLKSHSLSNHHNARHTLGLPQELLLLRMESPCPVVGPLSSLCFH